MFNPSIIPSTPALPQRSPLHTLRGHATRSTFVGGTCIQNSCLSFGNYPPLWHEPTPTTRPCFTACAGLTELILRRERGVWVMTTKKLRSQRASDATARGRPMSFYGCKILARKFLVVPPFWCGPNCPRATCQRGDTLVVYLPSRHNLFHPNAGSQVGLRQKQFHEVSSSRHRGKVHRQAILRIWQPGTLDTDVGLYDCSNRLCRERWNRDEKHFGGTRRGDEGRLTCG